MQYIKDVLDLNKSTELQLKLEKNGDLKSQMYLEINIPDVLSNILQYLAVSRYYNNVCGAMYLLLYIIFYMNMNE